MSDEYEQTLQEEYEVLESIFPDELERISENEIRIRVEPDSASSFQPLTISLDVVYPPTYPSTVPSLTLTPIEGALSDTEEATLLVGLQEAGEESLGMAMVFTLVTWLQGAITQLIHQREEDERREAAEQARREAEAEANRNRGTPVTQESFLQWKERFNARLREKRLIEEEELMKGMTPRERDEFRRSKTKLSGRQLFERDRNLDKEEENFLEEGVESVDFKQYDREAARAEEEEEEDTGIRFEDSD